MTEPIAAERFAVLVAAYGADLTRWPAFDQAAAEAFARVPEEEVPEAAALVLREAELDALLDAWQAPLPGAALLHRIAETAPRPRLARLPGLRWWGAALAGAGSLGALVGALALPVAAPAAASETSGYAMSYEQPIELGEDLT